MRQYLLIKVLKMWEKLLCLGQGRSIVDGNIMQLRMRGPIFVENEKQFLGTACMESNQSVNHPQICTSTGGTVLPTSQTHNQTFKKICHLDLLFYIGNADKLCKKHHLRLENLIPNLKYFMCSLWLFTSDYAVSYLNLCYKYKKKVFIPGLRHIKT